VASRADQPVQSATLEAIGRLPLIISEDDGLRWHDSKHQRTVPAPVARSAEPRVERTATRSVPGIHTRSPLPRRHLGYRQHGYATQRDPWPPLGRRRLRHRPPRRHQIARVSRLRTPRTRGKSRTARRPINLDPRTLEILHAWREHRANEDPEFDRDDPDAHVHYLIDAVRSIRPEYRPECSQR
jgi:hypothetical protein